MPRKPSAKRLTTEKKLVDAVGTILKKKGATGLGVNAVAAEAAVDKKLIYRYFGGLESLLETYGETADFWPSVDEVLGTNPERLKDMPRDRVAALALSNYVEALKKRKVTLDLLAHECVKRTPLTAALEAVRERRAGEIFQALATLGVSLEGNMATAGILFFAALTYLSIRGRDINLYGGMDVGSALGWAHIYQGIEQIFSDLEKAGAEKSKK